MGLRTMTIFGGVGQNPQVDKLRNGVDIVIATPGRLEDLMQQGHVRLSEVEVTVLDEADHMADLGFLPVVKRILDKTPRDTQRLLFSATLDNGVDILVKRYLNAPVTHSVDSATSSVPDMEHHVFSVRSADHKSAVVRELVSGKGRTLAFTRTKHAAKKLAKQLTAAGIPAVDLHGNLSQNARQHKAYLHRSGRTARAGAKGLVVTVGTGDQTRDIASLMRLAKIKPRQTAVAPGHPAITELTGPAAAFVDPASAPAAARPAPESSRSGSPRGRSRGAGGGRSQGGSSGRRSSGSSGSTSPRSTGGGGSRSRSGGSGRPGSTTTYSTSTGGAAAFSAGRRSR
jgi:superfamily II DNA/RNA helicase